MSFHCICFSVDKDVLFNMVKRIIDVRKNSSDTSKDLPFIDALLSAQLPEEATQADVISYLIGGFHTSGYCKCVVDFSPT